MKKTYNLWASVGMTLEVSEDEREEFLKNPEQFIVNGLASGKVYVDGDIHFPDSYEDNDEIGINE